MNLDIDKKKKCIKMLLEEDAVLYKQFLSKIEKMNDEEITNLFQGNIDYFKKEPDYHFKLLISKFKNFTGLLIAWYNQADKFIYLKEIWKKYIWLEDLIKLDTDKEREDYMIKKTKYKNWPQNVKNDFLTNINISNDIFYLSLKNLLII